MGMNQIGYPGANQIQPRVNFQQAGAGSQLIGRMLSAFPVTLQNGQSFIIPPGQWQVNTGRYTEIQYYDTNGQRWRGLGSQPGQADIVSSDGVNWRLANTTGTPMGAIITNVGTNGNATNGFNTITCTASAGNSSWNCLVGGTVNTTVTVTNGGNFSLPPALVWLPAANQTVPFIPPSFYPTMAGNAISSVTCQFQGAGLTAAGTLTAVNNPADTNPGGATLTLNATLTNSGNLTAVWPVLQGNAVTSVPTLTFAGTNNTGMAATVVMNFCLANLTSVGGLAGGNLGVSKAVMFVTANGVITSATQNAALTGTDYTTGLTVPRMGWLTGTSDANGNFNGNTTVTVVDSGYGIQAVPILACIPSNMNGTSTNSLPVVTAQVGGSTPDTSFLQCI